MKPPPFAYAAPRTLDEALVLVAEHGDEGKVLAGGQSLIPVLNFRLARPTVLVDLNGVAELSGISALDGGGVRIGAMTRQRHAERDPLVAVRAPLLAEALPFVAHPQIRNRGTIGGSLAHADPRAELPAVALALGARLHLRSRAGARMVEAHDFFSGLFVTALAADELVVAVELPALPPRTGCAFLEVARRHGDYAIMGVAAVVSLDARGAVAGTRLAYVNAGAGPVRAPRAEAALAGQMPDAAAVRAAAEAAAGDVDPPSDVHGSAAYRRQLARVLTGRAIGRAVERSAAAAH